MNLHADADDVAPMKIRVLHVITGLGSGGAEHMLLRLLSAMDRDRYDNHVVNLTDNDTLEPHFRALGVPVYGLDFRYRLGDVVQLSKLVRLMAKVQPDLVQTWMYHGDLIGGLASRLARVRPILWGIHHSNLDRNKNKWTTLWVARACARLSARIPNKIIACSKTAADNHIRFGYTGERFVIIPNGFDLEAFKPDSAARGIVMRELGIPEDSLLIGMMARFDPQKDHTGFLRAAIAIAEKHPHAYFLLCGKNVDWNNEELRNIIGASPFQARFSLLGYRDDVARLYAALDIHVLCSHGEAFPNVLGEAMACGVPCIAADVGDCRHIIGDTGLIYEAADHDALSHCMETMISSDRRQLGLMARRRIDTLFSIRSVAKTYESVYAAALTEERPWQCF